MKKSYVDLLMCEQLIWAVVRNTNEVIERIRVAQDQNAQLLAIAERQQAKIDYLHKELMIMGWLNDDQSWDSFPLQ